MKWSWLGRAAMGLLSALALGLSMTACGGGTIAYLWTIGQQYGQVEGFKVDDYTGNLTAVPGSPFGGGGSNPVAILVRPGGRYVYVINQGASYSTTANASDANVSVFSVGGEGSLTFQQSYPTRGFGHLWAAFDSTGTYLFVLDRYSPSGDGNGAITTFQSDPSTGQLILTTQAATTPSGGVSLPYIEVGANPLRMLSTGSCLFTINQGDQSITPYAVGGGGQLGTVTTGNIFPGTTRMTSINGDSRYVMVTDAGAPTTAGTPAPGFIVPYTISGTCGLTSFTGGKVANDPSVSNPVYSFLAGGDQYLYVLNQSTNTTNGNTAYSYITGFNIANGELSKLSTSPFKAGPGPVCMVEDPTSKFIYTSNYNDGSITGYTFDSTEGTLSDLSRGSSFTTNNAKGGCLALSGVVG